MRLFIILTVLLGQSAALGQPVFKNGFEQAGILPLSSTFLGGSQNERVQGAVVLADGSLLVAMDAPAFAPDGFAPRLLAGSAVDSPTLLLLLTEDASQVLSAARLPGTVNDLALDGNDTIYAACREGGLVALSPELDEVFWQVPEMDADRVSVSTTGRVAVLDNALNDAGTTAARAGTVHVFSPQGDLLGQWPGRHKTYDLAISAAGDQVVVTGFRQTSGPSGNPVQIAYLRALNFSGALLWSNYDWTGQQVDDPAAGGTGPTNNMADTRGVRVSFGADGMLYAAFMAAGGNHIFRYAPRDLFSPSPIVGGDAFHEFFNTRSEHKTFLARFDPANGDYLVGQQLVNRLSNGRGNTITLDRGGDIQADRFGRVYVFANAASGSPITLEPLPSGSYTGGSVLLVLSNDFADRELVTRYTPDADARTLALREFGGATRIVAGGGSDDQLFGLRSLQPDFGGGDRDGALLLLEGQ